MHSYTKVWIHVIWGTRSRRPLISSEIEPLIHEFLKDQFNQQGCRVRIINGTADHVHCLFNMPRDKSLAEIMKKVKGASSHFINSTNRVGKKFAWQTGYSAFSVSEQGCSVVAAYINNQKQHHQKRTFAQEHQTFLQIHGFGNAA